MSYLKVVAACAALFSLAVLVLGLTVKAAYSTPQFCSEQVFSESFTVPANATAYRSLTLNQQGTYHIIVNTPADHTILSGFLSEASFTKWQLGQFNVSWDRNFDLSGNSKNYYTQVNGGESPVCRNVVFWNTETCSKQVTLLVNCEDYGINSSGVNTANALLAAGAAGLGGVALFFAFKNRDNVKVTRKKVLVLTGSLLMLVLGGFLVITYSSPVEDQTGISQGTVKVSANDYYPLTCLVNRDGTYFLQVDVDPGVIQIFSNSDNSTMRHWSNGTEYDVRVLTSPVCNGSSCLTGYSVSGVFPYTEYYILSNNDSFSKNVTYQFSYQCIYNNYAALITGAAFSLSGLIAVILMLFKGKLEAFNKALEESDD